MTSICTLVPAYRDRLEPLEVVSFLRLKQLLNDNVFLVVPEGLNVSEYKKLWEDLSVIELSVHHFTSINSYNRMMLSCDFYEKFAIDYEWILIHQLDAFLFHADVESFTHLPYDYFGAPWVEGQYLLPSTSNSVLARFFGKRCHVGNGGLSLRKLAPTIHILKELRREAKTCRINEDGFFAYWGARSSKFRTCTFDVAVTFAFESNPDLLLRMNKNKLPMGCHAFNKISQETYANLINPLIKNIPGLPFAINGSCLPPPYQID